MKANQQHDQKENQGGIELIIGGSRGCGKTTQLIKKASEEHLYIVCPDQQRVRVVTQVAKDIGVDIPFPVTVEELPLKSPFIKEVLIDELEDVLYRLIGKPVAMVGTSMKLHELNLRKENQPYEDTEKWANQRLDELLLVERFKEMGKENDPLFQTLVFLGNGSQQLSLATTILSNYKEFPTEIKVELKSIQQQLQDFQEKLRGLEYCCACEGVVEPNTVPVDQEVCVKCYKSRIETMD